MKNKALRYSIYALGLLSIPLMTACIEETFPSSSATGEQVAKDPAALENIVNSLTNYTISTATYGGSTDYTDAGMPGFMMARDRMCEDSPNTSTEWDWYRFISVGTGTDWGTNPYYYFYTFIDKVNDMLKVSNPDELNDNGRHMIGNLYGFRAMSYMELARLYEFQPTGYSELDSKANSDGIMGLTVPIVEARDYTVAELVANPRAPFQTMYRFIMTDLDKAEELLDGFQRPKVSYINKSVIYGFKARMWLEMASRFDRSPDDLAKQIAAEGSDDGYNDLNITTALDCYRNAATYAEKVITDGFTPMSESEWHDPVNGFCQPNNSWVWGSYITSIEEHPRRWYAFPTWMNSDATWSWGGSYGLYQSIEANLFTKIPDSDWRKRSWISPDDAGNEAAAEKYSTNRSASDFAKLPAYVNLKFHVPNLTDYDPGLVTCVPFMRVEEMYLLRAEALYHTDGPGAAQSALDSFVNTYRYTDGSYACNASNYTDFIQKLMIQRRIELWGEGLVFYDYKRLRLGVNRAQPGTNYPETYRLVTASGYVAPWMNCYISDYAVSMKDASFKGNPNFSGVVKAAN